MLQKVIYMIVDVWLSKTVKVKFQNNLKQKKYVSESFYLVNIIHSYKDITYKFLITLILILSVLNLQKSNYFYLKQNFVLF